MKWDPREDPFEWRISMYFFHSAFDRCYPSSGVPGRDALKYELRWDWTCKLYIDHGPGRTATGTKTLIPRTYVNVTSVSHRSLGYCNAGVLCVSQGLDMLRIVQEDHCNATLSRLAGVSWTVTVATSESRKSWAHIVSHIHRLNTSKISHHPFFYLQDACRPRLANRVCSKWLICNVQREP